MFSYQENELKKLGVGRLKAKGKTHVLSSTQKRKVCKELKKTCGEEATYIRLRQA